MDQESTSAVKNNLHCPFRNTVSLRHTRLRELVSSAKPQIFYRTNDFVGVIGIYYFRSDDPEEMLQGFLDLDCAL